MAEKFRVSFPGTDFSPQDLPAGKELSRELDVSNSPLLFGCRTGICGTCICEVEGELPPASEEEKEIIDIFAPDNPKARLACQIRVQSDLTIIAMEEE